MFDHILDFYANDLFRKLMSMANAVLFHIQISRLLQFATNTERLPQKTGCHVRWHKQKSLWVNPYYMATLEEMDIGCLSLVHTCAKKGTSFFYLCLCLFHLCHAYHTSVNQALMGAGHLMEVKIIDKPSVKLEIFCWCHLMRWRWRHYHVDQE